MDQELKQLVGEAIKQANLFLSKEFAKPEDADVAFLDVLVHVSAIVKHGLRFHRCDPNNPPPGMLFVLEIAKGLAEATNGSQSVAHVLVDAHMKLHLVFTPLCPTHGADCVDQEPINPPRPSSLRELTLIGFNSRVLTEGIQDTFEEQMSRISGDVTIEEKQQEDGSVALFSHKTMRGEA